MNDKQISMNDWIHINDKWHHILMISKDGKTRKTFVDGVEQIKPNLEAPK